MGLPFGASSNDTQARDEAGDWVCEERIDTAADNAERSLQSSAEQVRIYRVPTGVCCV